RAEVRPQGPGQVRRGRLVPVLGRTAHHRRSRLGGVHRRGSGGRRRPRRGPRPCRGGRPRRLPAAHLSPAHVRYPQRRTGVVAMPRTPAQQVELAVSTLAAGGLVVVVDDEDRENEGDLVGAAATMTTEQMAFIVRHTTGIVCAPMLAHRADALDLPLMVDRNTEAHRTAFTVSVDHVSTGTGV